MKVAVTGPTGELGRSFLRALDREPAVTRVVGMARRPFEPESAKVRYDSRETLRALVESQT